MDQEELNIVEIKSICLKMEASILNQDHLVDLPVWIRLLGCSLSFMLAGNGIGIKIFWSDKRGDLHNEYGMLVQHQDLGTYFSIEYWKYGIEDLIMKKLQQEIKAWKRTVKFTLDSGGGFSKN